jgi:hypothetical protein
MIIGGGSTTELRIETTNNSMIINQGDNWVKVHIDDIEELIYAMEKFRIGDINFIREHLLCK